MGMEQVGNVRAIQAQTLKRPELSVGSGTAGGENTDVVAPKTAGGTDTSVNLTEKPENRENRSGTDSREKQPTNEQIKKAVEQMNKNMVHSEAIFGIHEETNRVLIKIVDKDTKEILKEYPPEKTLDMIAKIWELAGILVDEKR